MGVTLGAVRSELSPADLDFLVWANISMFASPSYHGVKLSRGRFEESAAPDGHRPLRHARPARRGTTGPDAASAPGRGGNGLAARASRRETLLAAAIPLFARQGYQATTMEDIGRAAGIAGRASTSTSPARSTCWWRPPCGPPSGWSPLSPPPWAGADDPGDALQAVVESHVAQLLDQTDLFSAVITEIVHVPDAERHLLRRIQHDYVSEWVQLLGDLRPDLSDTEARVVTHAVISLFNDVARMRRFRQRPQLQHELVRMGLELLTTETG